MSGKEIIEYESVSFTDFIDGPTEIEWIMDDIIPRHTTGIIAGESGVGKTWITLDLAFCIATGTPWLNKFETHKSKVLIVDEENAPILVRRRMKDLCHKYNVESTDLELMIANMVNITPALDFKTKAFTSSAGFNEFYKKIKEIKPDLIIIDSLTRIHHFDENSSAEMSELFRYVKKIVDDLDVAIIFTHHFNKGSGKTSRRIRGSSDIHAFADYTVLINRNGENGISRDGVQVKHDKSRWAEPIENFVIYLDTSEENQYDLRLLDKQEVTTWQWLKGFLIGRPMSRNEIVKAAEKQGIASRATIDRELTKHKNTNELVCPEYGKYTLSEELKIQDLLNSELE